MGQRLIFELLLGSLALREARHSYMHLCKTLTFCHHGGHNASEPVCEDATELQHLWSQLHTELLEPLSLLIICEVPIPISFPILNLLATLQYLPLLFALIWMAPVREREGSAAHSAITSFGSLQDRANSHLALWAALHRGIALHKPGAQPQRDHPCSVSCTLHLP